MVFDIFTATLCTSLSTLFDPVLLLVGHCHSYLILFSVYEPSHPPLQDPAGIFELVEVVGNGTYGQVYKVSSSTMLFYPSLFLFSLRFFHVNEPKQINKLYGIGKFKKENIC